MPPPPPTTSAGPRDPAGAGGSTTSLTAVSTRQDLHEAIDVAVRIGEALLSSGLSAVKVTAATSTVLRAYGVRGCSVDVTFTAIVVAYQGLTLAGQTFTRSVRHRSQDFTRLARVSALVDDIRDGRLGRTEASARLDRILSARHPFRAKLAGGAWAVLAVAVAVLTGAGPVVATAAASCVGAVYLMNRSLAAARVPEFFQRAAGALLVTLVAVALRAADVGVRPSLVVATGIVILVAGLAFTGAVEDALTGYYITASARLLEVAVLTGGIVAGVSFGLAVGNQLGVSFSTSTMTTPDRPLTVTTLAAGVAAAAFAYSCYAPRRALLPAFAAGAGAHVVYQTVLGVTDQVSWSAGIAATVAALVAHTVAGRIRFPAVVLATAAVVAMVPGVTIFNGLFTLIESGRVQGIFVLAGAVVTAAALASGTVLGEYLSVPVRRSLRRAEQFSIELRCRPPRQLRRAASLPHDALPPPAPLRLPRSSDAR